MLREATPKLADATETQPQLFGSLRRRQSLLLEFDDPQTYFPCCLLSHSLPPWNNSLKEGYGLVA
jgi:hypothetical protein